MMDKDYLNQISHFIMQYLVNIFSFYQLLDNFLWAKIEISLFTKYFFSFNNFQYQSFQIFDNLINLLIAKQ